MRGADQTFPEDRRTLTRRELLVRAVAFGAAGILEALVACGPPPSSPSPSATRGSVDAQSPTALPSPSPTPMPQPAPTLAPQASPTSIPDEPLFDGRALSDVFVAHDPTGAGYPVSAPFDPDERFPEIPYSYDDVAPDGGAYRLVREALRLVNPQGYGTAEWNPLSQIIRPGDRVLVKPNLVDDSAWADGQITHPAFLRPVIDFAFKACGANGAIKLAEGPWAAGVFERVVASTGIQAMVEHLAEVHGVPIVLEDLNIASRDTTPLVDLGLISELRAVDREWYDAHGQVMLDGEDPGIGRYRIAPSVLEADVVICVPKAKVHCSGGVTLAMKNTLGIIPAWDGPHEKAELKDCAHTSDVDRSADAQGMYLDNDTIWRSMADLNRILLYADAQGVLRRERQRRYLAIVDGIVAAEDSQYSPRPYPLNTVVVGTEPITVDAVMARCMGFDPRLLKSVAKAAQRTDPSLGPARPARIRVIGPGENGLSALYRHSIAPESQIFSWQGHLEATDFDPPEIADWLWDPDAAALQITVRDASGVAWVRVGYHYEGESRTRALQLTRGTSLEGDWRTAFTVGMAIHEATILAGDELFNETAQSIAW